MGFPKLTRLLVFWIMALALAAPAGAARQATSGRIDLYVLDNAFNLGGLKGPTGASFGYCGFLGPGKEKTGATCEKRLGREWEELWVEFVPEGDGPVDIDLQGEWYGQEKPGDLRLVWADDVRVEGASLQNGGFEDAGADGRPVGWRFTGDFPPDRYSRDGRVAHGGKACVAVWYGSQARRQFTVERGKTYRVRAWFRVLDPGAVRVPATARFEFPFETYTQEVTVTLKTEDAARKASLRALPLYDGREWAVSSRWDDNNPEDVRMRDVLAKHGHRGTFYLNSLWPDWSGATTTTNSPFGRELLKEGCTVGIHSLTHPFLSYCSRNRIFEEVAGDRMVWEAATDHPVVSYAFSYCNFANPHEGDVVHADIARVLERSGVYHVASEPSFENVPTDLVLSPIMPSDGADIDGFVENALGSGAYREKHPNLTYSMHVWYRTPEAWAKFEGQLEKYGHKPEWWYCNQNEYAAYRYQHRYTRLGRPVVRGRSVRLRLERPALLDLDDEIPLTLEVAGVPRDAVAGVRCGTAECTPSGKPGGPFHFHLSHDREQALPSKIGMVVPNTRNRSVPAETDRDTDFPGVKALLCQEGGEICLLLVNEAGEPLRQVRVTYRLPLGWKEGVARHRIGDVAPGTQRRDALKPTQTTRDYRFHSGSRFLLAQIDFRRGAEQGRLYASCYAEPEPRDVSYPQGGFLRLGPVKAEQLNLVKLAADVQAGRIATQPWVLPDDSRLVWQADDGPLRAPFLDVELIGVSGAWWGREAGLFLLQSNVRCDSDRQAELRAIRGTVRKAFLNGEDVTDRETISLRAGGNRLLLVAGEAPGCFVRLVKPGTEERLAGVRFEFPAVPEDAEPYAPAMSGAPARKTLVGKWRAKLTLRLPPAPSIQAPHLDKGISAEAQALVRADADDSGWPEVEVPRRWKDCGAEWADTDGEAVFRRTVEVPEAWAGKDLILSLGPIDDFDTAFFNGVAVGHTDRETPEFYAVPRQYRVPTALVKPGWNVIAVRIFDHFGDGGLTGEPRELFLAPKE